MISVTRFRAADPSFEARAQHALTVLGARDGFVRGSLARSTDDTADWVLVTEWVNVGSYRRALGNYEVKLYAAPLLGEALDEPSSFEQLVQLEAGAEVLTFASDREPPRPVHADGLGAGALPADALGPDAVGPESTPA